MLLRQDYAPTKERARPPARIFAWCRRQAVLAPRHSCHFFAGIKNLWSNKKTLTLKLRMAASWGACLWMALKTGKKQLFFACYVSAVIKFLWSNTKTLTRKLDNGRILGSAHLDGAEDRQKTCAFCFPLFCRYQDFVEQHQDTDPEVDNGRIMGSASLDGAQDRQKIDVLCMPLLCTPLGVLLKSTTCANNQGCRDHFTASSHVAEDRHSTKTGVLAPWHSVCRMQLTSVVRASTECDVVPKGAIPFCAFAH